MCYLCLQALNASKMKKSEYLKELRKIYAEVIVLGERIEAVINSYYPQPPKSELLTRK